MPGTVDLGRVAVHALAALARLLAVVFRRIVSALRALPATLNTLNKEDMIFLSLGCYWPAIASCSSAIFRLMNVRLA